MSSARGYVNIQLHVRDAAAVQSFLNPRHQINATEKDLNNLSEKSGRRAKSTSDRFTSAMRQMPAAIAQFAGIGTALGTIATFAALVRREYETIRQINMKAGQVQFDTEKEFRGAAGMLALKPDPGDITEADLKRIVLEEIAPTTGHVGPGELFGMAKPALSARGKISARESLQLVGMIAGARQEETFESRNAMVGASLALRKAYGYSNEEAFGLVQGSIAAARPEEMQTFARNLVPRIASLKAFGNESDTAEDIAALVIGIGQRAEDPTGRQTGTGAVKAVKDVMVAAKSKGLVGRDASIMDTFKMLSEAKPGSEAAALVNEMTGVFSKKLTPEEYQAMVRGDVEAMPGMSAEARTYIPIMELLDSQSQTWEGINYARGIIPGRGEAFTLVQDRIDRLNAIQDAGSLGYQASGKLKPTTAKMQLGSNRGILERLLPDIKEQLLLSGAYGTETMVEDVTSRLRTSIDASPEEIIQQQIDRLRGRKKRIEEGTGRVDALAKSTGVGVDFGAGSTAFATDQEYEMSAHQRSARDALVDSINGLTQVMNDLRAGNVAPSPVTVTNPPGGAGARALDEE